MFLAVHASVGALAGNAVVSPALALALGFISHFFVDMIPHGDEHMYEGFKNGNRIRRAVLYVAADALATIALVALMFLRQDFFSPLNVSLGILGGLLPDIIVGFCELAHPQSRRWLSRKLAWFHGLHMQNHHFLIKRVRKHERDIPLKYGLLLQGVVLTALLRTIMR